MKKILGLFKKKNQKNSKNNSEKFSQKFRNAKYFFEKT